MRAELPVQVVELVDAFRNPIMQIEFLYLLANAKILEPVLVDAETAACMVRPYSWFLDRVATEGIKLTSAGYLPPADVEAASAGLGLAGEWIGKHNRGDSAVHHLNLPVPAPSLPFYPERTRPSPLAHGTRRESAEATDTRSSPVAEYSSSSAAG
jgi:hypothetical protein